MSEIARDSHRTDRARASLEELFKQQDAQINDENKAKAVRNIVERFKRDTDRIVVSTEEGQTNFLSQGRVSIFDNNQNSANVSEEIKKFAKDLGRQEPVPETSLEGRVTRQK